jgi:hypothetical protein
VTYFLAHYQRGERVIEEPIEEPIEESIINWGRKYFGTDAKDEDIFFIKTVIEEREKRNPNLSPP